ncbi:MAG: hypothetical protein HRU15_10375, partial [Planctomycetes bacterium]|nr:hypothetical protein [Planctomycetota bacterium]
MTNTPSDQYTKKKEYVRKRDAEMSRDGRDIGPLPDVMNSERKEACTDNFQLFCESYFPLTFNLGWSADHLRIIGKIEQAVLHGGLFALAMPRGSGKALSLETPLAGPDGWTTMGEIQIGDTLFDERGHQCQVTYVTPIQNNRPCYRVTFDDGATIIADADHVWTVKDRYGRKHFYNRTTEWLQSRLCIQRKDSYNEYRFRINCTQPIEMPPTDLTIEPYALGVWLGDGTSANAHATLHQDDAEEIKYHIERHLGVESLQLGVQSPHTLAQTVLLSPKKRTPRCFQVRLRELNLLNNKHIPHIYLRASVQQRWALLQGLMDTDGYVSPQGHCEIIMKPRQLADNFQELLWSLGIKHGRSEKYVTLNGKRCGPYQRIMFTAHAHQDVFSLQRKKERLPQSLRYCEIHSHRSIISIEAVHSVPVRCIQVNSPSHLYLAGKHMIPTHNTSIAECAGVWAMLYGHGKFICLIGSDEGAAVSMLESIKTELESNELLADDFPEVCYPIQRLEGIAHRCNGQLYNGERTQIHWTANQI